MRSAQEGGREPITVGPFIPNELIVVANRFGSELPDLDPRYHCSCLSFVRVPYRPSNPLLPIADHQEQWECRDHWSSLCLGCTSSLPARAPLHGLTWGLAICDYGLLREETSGDSAQITEDIQGVQATRQGRCPRRTSLFPAVSPHRVICGQLTRTLTSSEGASVSYPRVRQSLFDHVRVFSEGRIS